MKIKTQNIKSAKLVVPIDGLIEIDANGIAEVSEACAKIMVEKTNSWNYVKEEVETETAEEEVETETAEEVESEEKVETREDFEKKIRLMKFEDLKAFAVESGCDEKEVNSITTKKAMVNYLLEQFDSAE